MQNKVAVITGATSGIGQAAAQELARRGAKIVFVARDQERAAATLDSIKRLAPAQQHEVVFGDLSLLADMKRIGAEIVAIAPKVDVLVNNAGALFTTREETADGLERTFAVNHMSYFVLTNALLPALRAGAGGRIVCTSSSGHDLAPLDFEDLQFARKKFAGFVAYGASKLCNLLFARALTRRLADSSVTINCFHPGFTASRVARNNGGIVKLAFLIGQPFAAPAEKGAETLIYLATSPEVAGISGKYFIKQREAAPARFAQDDDAAERLWAISEAIARK